MGCLTTVARIKSVLDIPAKEEAWNGDLASVLAGVEEELLELTGFDLAEATRTEYYPNQQLGRAFHLKRRPVASLTTVQGRYAGGSFIDLQSDLLEPEEGKVMLIGDFSSNVWPPREQSGAEWYRWREQTYDIVKVVYETAGMSTPADLEQAAIELAVYRFRRRKAGASSASSLSGVSETFMLDSIPDWVQAKLARYIRPKLVWQ
jgi:hypothetical protein